MIQHVEGNKKKVSLTHMDTSVRGEEEAKSKTDSVSRSHNSCVLRVSMRSKTLNKTKHTLSHMGNTYNNKRISRKALSEAHPVRSELTLVTL